MNYFESIFGLNGKVALVTGAATGIGKIMANGLAQAGAKVFIVSRKVDRCELAAEEINDQKFAGSAEGFAGDVSNEAGVDALAEELAKRTDRLDILINNAGRSWGAPISEFPYAAWESVERTNSAGPFFLTRNLLPLLQKSATPRFPSRVINIGSVMGYVPVSENAYSYAASKAALHHITKILAKEFAGKGVTFNAVVPGPFPSRITDAAAATMDGGIDQMAAMLPSGRLGAPEDIVGPILYLCGQGGSYTTGAVIPIDGGFSVQTGRMMA